ncbi:hypothetical protein QCN32_gp67 [Arthrobacter phage Niktson]|uniref:Uncharacterized protein n=1 Tax=Arthrobacter phage Niktson TaxID=2014347 RepID=A0A218M5R9_9CAUD|nr:hypothetical protein QCN32_gp67 [Arthrobacter phage Niktson]ASD52311.1 hypothetical protein NIKTSON_67 [Arthrobacter phage Niktson]ASD52406.1 hypothetical protein ELEPHANTMAN_67 [Arthrobacter phage ElephantMan]
MGSGLKPSFTPTCPKCSYVLKYHVRDPEVNPSGWAMTAESWNHLREAHVEVPQVRKTPIVIRNHRRRRVLRLPSSRRRTLV